MTCGTTHHHACDCREAMFKRLRDAAYAVQEYFEAIQSGEYPNSRPELRPFEDVLLNRIDTALKAFDNAGETP